MKKAILKQEVERTFGRQLTETRDFEPYTGEPQIIFGKPFVLHKGAPPFLCST